MKRNPVTAGELLDRLYADPEWAAAKQERDRKFAEIRAASEQAQVPLLEELESVGVKVRSVWDLVNTKSPYPAAVPVLLDHLNGPYPERVREGIARSLAVREARPGWPILLKTFREDPNPAPTGAKWGLALALATTATKDKLDDVISLLRERSHGENRMPLLSVLVKANDPRIDPLLDELSDDSSIALDVAEVKRRREKRRLAEERKYGRTLH